MGKIFLYVSAAFVLSLVSCADDKRQAIRVGDRFMDALIVKLDTALLRKYVAKDAKRYLNEWFEDMDSAEMAETNRYLDEKKNKFELDEQKSIFGKTVISLVYDVSVGPDYDGKYQAQLELTRLGGEWKVTLYSL